MGQIPKQTGKRNEIECHEILSELSDEEIHLRLKLWFIHNYFTFFKVSLMFIIHIWH